MSARRHYAAIFPGDPAADFDERVAAATGTLYDDLAAANLAALGRPVWALAGDQLVAVVPVEPDEDLTGNLRPDSSRSAYAADLLDRWAA